MYLNNLEGEKKEKAILSLGEDVKNADLLLSIAQSEKGRYQQAALRALVRFDYPPAIPIWKKHLKSKSMGEKIFLGETSDAVSNLIAEEFIAFISHLLCQPGEYVMTEQEWRKFKTYLSIILGKGSSKTQEMYMLIAENMDKLSELIYRVSDNGLLINTYLHFYKPSPSIDDAKKIFPAVLSMSILYNLDKNLISLAQELYSKYKGNWLSPVFIANLLTKPSKEVYEKFASYLKNSGGTYLKDTFGALFFDKKTQRHSGLLFWGQYEYGEIDTRFSFERTLFENLEERWFFDLTEAVQEKVPLQAYHRSGVWYEAYDEMLVGILPNIIRDKRVEKKLKEYFTAREKQHNGFSTVYLDALYTLNSDITEEIINRYIRCSDNGVSKYSLRVTINNLTNWSNKRKVDFYNTLSPKYVMREELEALKE
ncbi:hypothetical protein AAG747_04700 [Rapidithrix thailandica]|uniref:Uncharacterized protein n=1 Tax=Rapidithrix thailandica TaxID=413964 RepID=A0AAW9S2Q8_9BACT